MKPRRTIGSHAARCRSSVYRPTQVPERLGLVKVRRHGRSPRFSNAAERKAHGASNSTSFSSSSGSGKRFQIQTIGTVARNVRQILCRQRKTNASLNEYSSIYLWSKPSFLTEFFTGDFFENYADAFGRPTPRWALAHQVTGDFRQLQRTRAAIRQTIGIPRKTHNTTSCTYRCPALGMTNNK